LLKTEGIVHFANAQRIGDLTRHLIDEFQAHVVVLDCSAIPDFEYSALNMLRDAERRLHDAGVRLCLAGLNPEPLELIRKSALGERLGRERMFFNVDQAVKAFQAESLRRVS
jgi:MFS superfamily sulfate permease-like transporter